VIRPCPAGFCRSRIALPRARTKSSRRFPTPSVGSVWTVRSLVTASQLLEQLNVSYRRIPLTAKRPAARIVEETQFYGVPRLRIAQALGQMWALPRFVVELFSIERHQSRERWGSSQEMFKGLVIGCSSLVDAMTGPPSPSTMEAAKGGSSRGAACRRTCSATSLCAH